MANNLIGEGANRKFLLGTVIFDEVKLEPAGILVSNIS
jgi:hypothetical protein